VPITTVSGWPATWFPTTWVLIHRGSSNIPTGSIARHQPPYPAYSFEGPDLSSDGRVEIKIEDHYYEQTDAAVVFRRRDRASGEDPLHLSRQRWHKFSLERYCANFDYLNPAVREQVIQTILHVAGSSGDSLRCRNDFGQTPFSPALVSGSRIERRDSIPRRIQHERRRVQSPHAP